MRYGCGKPVVPEFGNSNAKVGEKVRSAVDRTRKREFAADSLKSYDKACENNWRRRRQCPSNHVLWNETNPLWLPFLDVEDVLEVVYPQLCKKHSA